MNALSGILVFSLLSGVAAQTGTLLELYNSQKTANDALYAAQVMTTRKGEVVWGATGAFGERVKNPSDAMRIDTPVRVSSVAELLVVATALSISRIRENVDSQVPSSYMPNGLALKNPRDASNSKISYAMLMQHTSSLIDRASYADALVRPTCTYSTGTCTGVSTDVTFASWVETTFATAGATTINSNVFSDATPGTVQYSHLNTALLAYIVQGLIADGNATLSVPGSSVGALVYERILQPSGMASSFYSELQGTIARTTDGALSAMYNAIMYEYTSTTTATVVTFVHPNRPADVQLYSTPGDMLKLAAQILDSSDTCTNTNAESLCSIGKLMRQPSNGVSTTFTTGSGRALQVSQGLGVMFYSSEQICALLLESKIFTKCPLQTSHNVWGYMTGETGTDLTTISGILCTDATGTTSTNRASCVAVTQGYTQGTANLLPQNAFAMAAGAFQLAFGETTVTTATTDDSTNDLYGLWVGFGVVGTIVFVVAASFFTEFLIQPPPPIGPGAGFRPGQSVPAM